MNLAALSLPVYLGGVSCTQWGPHLCLLLPLVLVKKGFPQVTSTSLLLPVTPLMRSRKAGSLMSA